MENNLNILNIKEENGKFFLPISDEANKILTEIAQQEGCSKGEVLIGAFKIYKKTLEKK